MDGLLSEFTTVLSMCLTPIRIPGEQEWSTAKASSSKNDVADALASLSIAELPPPAKGSFPLSKEDFTGALLKVYDPEASYQPASAYDVVGIVSLAPMPSSLAEERGEDSDPELVPCIHVLVAPTRAFPPAPVPENLPSVRSALVSYLATAFSPPDEVAAELLLLALLAYPATRRAGIVLGTFSLNLVRPTSETSLVSLLESVVPAVVPLPLTIPLLHSETFNPTSDGTTLTPGRLQLAPGTLLVIDEDGLGDGGALAEKALRNIQALKAAITDQVVQYMYPYTDGVRIECALRSVITSEASSLLPADIHVPVTLAKETTTDKDEAQLDKFRAYLSSMSSATHAEKLKVPESVSEVIQDAFVADRKVHGSGSAEAAEERLRRRMKIARLVATSYPAAELTVELWEKSVALDEEVERRLRVLEEKRREENFGAPVKKEEPKANGESKEETKESTDSTA